MGVGCFALQSDTLCFVLVLEQYHFMGRWVFIFSEGERESGCHKINNLNKSINSPVSIPLRLITEKDPPENVGAAQI